MPGRPRIHASHTACPRAAYARAVQRARSHGIVQRSIALPEICWAIIREARMPSETSDAQTLARLLQGQA